MPIEWYLFGNRLKQLFYCGYFLSLSASLFSLNLCTGITLMNLSILLSKDISNRPVYAYKMCLYVDWYLFVNRLKHLFYCWYFLNSENRFCFGLSYGSLIIIYFYFTEISFDFFSVMWTELEYVKIEFEEDLIWKPVSSSHSYSRHICDKKIFRKFWLVLHIVVLGFPCSFSFPNFLFW